MAPISYEINDFLGAWEEGGGTALATDCLCEYNF